MPTVFISYSHRDTAWKDRLVTHLSVLADEGLFEVWDDTRIGAGQDWEREIEAAMSSAAVTVLMVSPDFLASKFVKTREVPRLLQRRQQEGLRVIPVIVRPCPWQRIPWLSAMQARPKDGRPLSSGSEYQIDADLAAIAEEIVDILQAFETPRPATGVSAAPSSSSTVPQPARVPVAPKEALEEPARGEPSPAEVIPKEPAARPAATARPEILTVTEPIRMEFVRVDDGRPLRMGTPPGQVQEMLKRLEWAKEWEGKGWFKDERPGAVVRVAPFAIGRYPVTNAQYAAFVEATGHPAPRHFGDWGLPPAGKEDHPVVHVSWRDAVAFTEWLSRAIGRSIRLPSEVEWEKAARGADGRLWLWGDEWDPKLANTLEGGSGETTPVGRYSPRGDSPCSAADMAGNVWEWCSTKWRADYTTPADDSQSGDDARVVRGGSWLDSRRYARCAARFRYEPAIFYLNLGFRVVLSLSS